MNRRLRVLHLVTSLTIGGAEQIVLSLADRVDRRRFETHVCSLSVVRNNSLQPAFEQLGIPLLVLNARRFYDPKTIRTVEQYVRQHQIDLIHTHLIDADIIGRFLGALLKVPVISTLQNVPFNHTRQRRDKYWLERLTARYLATHLVAVSDMVRDLYVKEWGIPPARLSVVYNTVRMEPFLAVPPGVPAESPYPGPVITNVARLSPQKAQHLLIKAAPMVLARYPEARFLIVGKGHLESELRYQIAAAGLQEQVLLLGVRHDIPDILAQSDLFALPSQWEGFPLSVVEAMAAARPVVVTAVGGNTELVETEQSGLVIPPDDVTALGNALVQLLDDEPKRLALGAAARLRVQRLFSTERFIQQYETLYRTLGEGRYQPEPIFHTS